MKIKQLRLKNFAKFEDFELVFKDGVTKLIGMNGSGKTTVGLTAIWAGFKGIVEKSTSNQLIGQRFRFIPDGKKSSDIEILLHDENTGQDILLKRHITKTGNTISIEAVNGNSQPTASYIENLFNVTFLSASHFTSLSGKEQALAMGIDVDKYDKQISNLKFEAACIRKEIANNKIADVMEKCEPVNVDELFKEKEKLYVARQKINILESNLHDWNIKLADAIKEQKELAVLEASLRKSIIDATAKLETAPKVDDSTFDKISEQIKTSQAINTKAELYNQQCIKLAMVEDKKLDLQSNLEEQEKMKVAKNKFISSKSFGIPNLTVDETGNLLMNGKPIRPPYFSKGELEMIVARISASLNPELKVRFIDDFEMLDENNQKTIIENLTSKGFQIITAEVGEKQTGDNVVLLRECKVVK